MAFFALKKNQHRPLVIAALVIAVVIAAFVLAGKKNGAEWSDAVVTGTETKAESSAQSPQRAPSSASPSASPSVPAVVAPSTSSLNGSTFRLSAYNGHVLPETTSYTVSFEAGTPPFEDGVIRAKFCNTMTAKYRLAGRVLRGSVTGTKMYCAEPQGVMDLEGAFGVLVDGGSQIALQGNSLTLSDGVKTMVFVRQ